MSKILHSVIVRGKGATWCIHAYITKQTAQDWRDDGLDVTEILNVIPEWWVNWGLPVRLWCFVQDCIHFKNPLAK